MTMTKRSRAAFRGRWPLAVSMSVVLASTVGLGMLPGRTSSHGRVEIAEASAAPQPGGFHLDGLRWDLDRYRADPHLEPLRAFMRAACASRRGLDAAVCISDEFARRFPNSPPKHEFLDASYDPVTDLEVHLAGAPGQCTTRSSLEAAILLAAGVNARQVQITGAQGHNVLEVYDEQTGWVIFDPTFGAIYATPERPGRPVSVAEAVSQPTLVPTGVSLAPSPISEAPHEIGEALFPDPWLYTRSGERAAHWPFRGRFIHVGAASFRYGRGQEILRGCFLVSALAALFLLVKLLRARRASAAARKENNRASSQPA